VEELVLSGGISYPVIGLLSDFGQMNYLPDDGASVGNGLIVLVDQIIIKGMIMKEKKV
jgi:hypothetical protein